jgi:ribosome-binding factor A
MGNERARRLADRIQIIVAQTLQKRVKDPRLGMVTVTDVRITNDLREVTVFYTALGDEQARSESAVALTKATGLVRSEVGRVTGLKHTPSLVFIADAIPENAAHIEDLLRTARESDEAVSAIRVGATYAGDPDPYRTPADRDDDEDDDEDDELDEDEGDAEAPATGGASTGPAR